MKSTIILGSARHLVLPEEMCQLLHLSEGDVLDIEMDGNGIHLRPSSEGGVTLVREGELLVATGYPKGVDIGAAVLADRDDRGTTVVAPYARVRGVKK